MEKGCLYTIHDVDKFLKFFSISNSQIITAIKNGFDDLRYLKMAIEVYGLRSKSGNVDKLDFSSKTLLMKSLSVENVTIVCDILKNLAKIQTNKQFNDAAQYVKKLDFENGQMLFIYLQILNVFIELHCVTEIVDETFIILLYKTILSHNLNKEKNYFITNILKVYFVKNRLGKDRILNEIINSFDMFTILCLISEITPEKIDDSFWIKIQSVIIDNSSHWDYKLALNILKSIVNIVDENNLGRISKIIRGCTDDVKEFRNEWQNFFNLIEVAEEKQLHLVQPSLILLENIGKMNFAWVQCIYNKLLNHIQLSVVYNAGIVILNNRWYELNNYREFLQCVLSGINRNDYSEYAEKFFQKLKDYVACIDLNCYDMLLEESGKINWTPFAAWLFYSNCLNRLCDIKCERIQEILDNLKKLPHRYIRDGCFDMFYNYVVTSSSASVEDKLKIIEIFNSYNDNYTMAYTKKDINKLNSKCLEALSSSLEYGTHEDYYKNTLDTLTQKILKERISSDVCINYLTYLCLYLSKNPNYIPAEDMENLLDTLFGTQHEDVSVIIYKSFTTLLKPFVNYPSRVERMLLNAYYQLKSIKQYDNRRCCSNFYFKAFFTYCDDWINTGDDSDWSKIFDEVIQDEILGFSWISNLPQKFQLLFLQHVLKLIYFGNYYTKQRRYEDTICHQIFSRNGGVLTSEVEPSLQTRIRLEALKICVNLKTNSSKLLDVLLNMPQKRYFPDSSDHAYCLRSVQTILVLIQDVQFCNRTLFDKILWHLCEMNHQPAVRQLMQWILIKLSLLHSDCFDLLIEKFGTSTAVSTLSSIILVLYHVALFSKNNSFAERSIQVMLQYTTGAIFKLRVYSQVAICKLISKRKSEDERYILLHNLLKKTMEENTESIKNVLQFDRELFETFDPDRNYHLRTIFVDIPKMNNVFPSEWQYIEFNLDKHPCYENILPMDSHKNRLHIFVRDKKKIPKIPSEDVLYTGNIQKKIVPFNMCYSESLNKKCIDLVVIASLVTSSANLGGLARTCEIYGVKRMVVDDDKIVNDKDFKSLSMSSECWLDIVQVKTDNLVEYIIEEKKNGYSVLGAEQTCESVKLSEFKFPEKCVLLLGNEKQGIPSHLLPYLDVCVEIPQFGFVRSLNVHVAGSTFIWEYVRQTIK